VIHISVGLVSALLVHIAEGLTATTVVDGFTLWIIISFMDYVLLKTLPAETTYLLMFVIHSIVMVMVIYYLWVTFG
jgi:hypothetical protein